MNDPHVQHLLYQVKHGPTVEYARAVPLIHQTLDFEVAVENGIATFTAKTHFATLEAARVVADRLVAEWELETLVTLGPDVFSLEYESCKIIDRDPSLSTYRLSGEPGRYAITGSSVGLRVSRLAYPPPPKAALKIDGDIEVMRDRYLWSRSGRESITTTAYFCLTLLEGTPGVSGRRRRAAETYGIAEEVLKIVGHLSSTKGGVEARKVKGLASPLREAERNWLDAAIKMMIRRFAEYKADPAKAFPQITMADLPEL